MTLTPNGRRVIAMAMITVQMPPPTATRKTIASTRVGKDMSTSTTRWLRMSNLPPRYALAPPRPGEEDHRGSVRRPAPAVDQPAEHVSAFVVRAQPVFRGWRLLQVVKVLKVGVIGGHHGG